MAPERETLQSETAFLYLKAVRLLDPLRLQVWEEMRITFPQLRILFQVRNNPEVDLRTLATRLGISTSAASQQVDKLVERGFIDRSEDPEDRRRVRLVVTEDGQQITGEISRATNSYLETIFAGLSTEELTDLSRALTRVLEAATEKVATV
jgi:DNA-binding MarR family transcriptional regulator